MIRKSGKIRTRSLCSEVIKLLNQIGEGENHLKPIMEQQNQPEYQFYRASPITIILKEPKKYLNLQNLEEVKKNNLEII